MPDVDWIRKLCLSFPDATEDMPWADDLCFKVRGKIFTGMALSDGRFPRLTLKCAPEKFHELLEIEGISPAPYVGRYKWVTLANSNVLPAKRTRSPHSPVVRDGRSQSAQSKKRKSTRRSQTPQEITIRSSSR
jgi:predicted DNA-binding protein (MmcQ/YjbR family)